MCSLFVYSLNREQVTNNHSTSNQFKRILDMFHNRLLTRKGDSNDIKSRVPMMQPMLTEKKQCGFHHPPLFVPMNRLQGGSKTVIGTSLYFHKDNHASIQSDEIQLSHTAAVIPLYESIASLLQIVLCDLFSLSAENLLLLLHSF